MKFLSFKKALAFLSLGLIFAVMACQPKLAPEEDCNFVMNSQIQRVSWKNQLPVRMQVSRDVPQDLRASIRFAASRWNYILKKEAIIIYEDNNFGGVSQKDGINGIYWISDWGTNKPEEQGKTTIHWKADLIQEADILINAQNYRFSPQGDLMAGYVDFTSLMVHEFGHVLGLNHIQGIESVMNPSLAMAKERVNPYDMDIESLKCEYN